VQYDLDTIKRELHTLPAFDNQIYLQGIDEGMDPINPTLGQNYLDANRNEIGYRVPLFDIPYINDIIHEHRLTRTRVMRMFKKTCYYWHKDITQRLHIPIVTNEHCFLVFEDGTMHLPATGKAYIIDTTRYHSAMNASKQDRIHIIGNLPK